MQIRAEAGQSRAATDRPEESWPVGWCAAAVLVLAVATYVVAIVRARGMFVYPLDDTYIHMRLADNLRHGTFGVNPGEFAAAGSSPMWAALLAAATSLRGVKVGVPLVLATVAGAAALAGADRWARGQGLSPVERCLLAAALLVVVPMPTMALLGMEHTLQIAVTLLLTAVSATVVNDPTRRNVAILALCAAIGVSVRAETLFVVAAIAAILIFRRRFAAAGAIVAAAFVPLLAVAALNIGQGWPAAPASIVIKSGLIQTGIARFLPTFHPGSLVRNRLLIVLVLCIGTWIFRHRRLPPGGAVADHWSTVFVVTSAFHLCYAQLGWMNRYEAYLVALGICAIAVNLHLCWEARTTVQISRWATAAVVVLCLVAAFDGAKIIRDGYTETEVIRHQQLEMARFTREACAGCRVAVNDIGAVSLYGDVTVTDVFGLADRRVLEAKESGTWDVDALERVAASDGATLAMVFTDRPWIPGVPSTWEQIGSWEYSPSLADRSRIAFFSLDPSRTEELQRAFEAFDPGESVHKVP